MCEWDLCWSMPSYSNNVMYYFGWRCFIFLCHIRSHCHFRVFKRRGPFFSAICVCVYVLVINLHYPVCTLKLSKHKYTYDLCFVHIFRYVSPSYIYVEKKPYPTHTYMHTKQQQKKNECESTKWLMFHGWRQPTAV